MSVQMICITPVFRFDTVSSRDKRTLSSIVVISNIKDSSPLSRDVLRFNVWSIFCDSKTVLHSYCKVTKAIRNEQYLIAKSYNFLRNMKKEQILSFLEHRFSLYLAFILLFCSVAYKTL